MYGPTAFLAIFVSGLGLGGVILGAALLRTIRAQIALTLFLSLMGFLLFHSAEHTPSIFRSPGGDALAFPTIALVTWLASHWLFTQFETLRRSIDTRLSPRLWSPAASQPLSSTDFAKRWFVTVAAATGSVVGMLLTDGGFWKLFVEALAPGRLLIALLLTVVSFTLIGPVESYILGRGLGGEAGPEGAAANNHLERILQQMSWRAVGRLGLVLALILQLNVMHVCLEEKVRSGDVQTTLTILLASTGPAVITYFWSAALQRGVPRIARRTGVATIMATTLLLFPGVCIGIPALTIQQTLAAGGAASVAQWAMLTVMCVIAFGLLFIFSILLATVADGGAAFLGGMVLESQRRGASPSALRTIALLTAVLMAYQTASGIMALVVLLAIRAHLAGADYLELFKAILSCVGWGVGLLVSGFPDILKRAPSVAPPSPAAAIAA